MLSLLTAQNSKLIEKNSETTRFNHSMIFLKFIDQNKTSDTYINHNNCLGHMFIKMYLHGIL